MSQLHPFYAEKSVKEWIRDDVQSNSWQSEASKDMRIYKSRQP